MDVPCVGGLGAAIDAVQQVIFLRTGDFYFCFEMIWPVPDHAMVIKVIPTGMNVTGTETRIAPITLLAKLQQHIAISET